METKIVLAGLSSSWMHHESKKSIQNFDENINISH